MVYLERRTLKAAWMAAGWLVLLGIAWAQAEPTDKAGDSPSPVKRPTATSGQIAGWVSQLTSRDFQERRAASRQLVAAGQAAIEPVAKAAEGDDLERTTRCISVLRQLLVSADKPVKVAAEAALTRLSENKNPKVARRAEAALPKADPKPGGRGTARKLGRIQVRNGTRVSTRVINGQRTIEVTEPDRKVAISDLNGKDIRIKITTMAKGKPVTREVKADSAEELKKADPEAAKLYQQYAVNNPLRIRVGAFPPRVRNGGRRALPLNRGARVLPLPPGIGGWQQRVESAQEKLGEAVERLQKLAGQPQTKPEELREVLKQLGEAQKTLSGLLGPDRKATPRRRPAKPPQKSDAKPKVIKTRGV